jgi:hypothetical protein
LRKRIFLERDQQFGRPSRYTTNILGLYRVLNIYEHADHRKNIFQPPYSILFLCSLFNDAVSNLDYPTSKDCMTVNNTLEMWKWLLPNIRLSPSICVEGQRKSKKKLRIVGVLAEIRIVHLSNKNKVLLFEMTCWIS